MTKNLSKGQRFCKRQDYGDPQPPLCRVYNLQLLSLVRALSVPLGEVAQTLYASLSTPVQLGGERPTLSWENNLNMGGGPSWLLSPQFLPVTIQRDGRIQK